MIRGRCNFWAFARIKEVGRVLLVLPKLENKEWLVDMKKVEEESPWFLKMAALGPVAAGKTMGRV